MGEATLLAASATNAALYTFLLYTVAVFVIAGFANRLLKGKDFLGEYFLGSRGLGTWAFALTFAATSASGGSFTGFPALIYTHGWILALWIASYMVYPLCTMGLLGKRINQVARKTNAITVPDVLRDRFESPAFGLLSTSLILFFLTVNLIAQFKAGAVILQTLVQDVEVFQVTRDWTSQQIAGVPAFAGVQPGYLVCLMLFGVAVIVYTTYGGFHAVVWTDVLQGIVMVAGVMIMLPLAISQVGGLEQGTRALEEMRPSVELARATVRPGGGLPGSTFPGTGSKEIEIVVDLQNASGEYEYVHIEPARHTYVTGPGPHERSIDGFLPLGAAISFFFMWAISGTGQPQYMVRLMAFKDSRTLRRAIITVTIYFGLIYFPLVIIFCLARVLVPGMEGKADSIMPTMAVTLTSNAGVPWLAGLLIAAPFAAVMSTVDSYLLVISSSAVRDIYQRNINPDADERTIKRLSYLATLIVGGGAMLLAVNPPEYLQDIIVYVGSGLACCFLFPVVAALYFPRANLAGCISGMLVGFLAHLLPHVAALLTGAGLRNPLTVLGMSPLMLGLAASLLTVLFVTPLTAPPRTNSCVATSIGRRRTGTTLRLCGHSQPRIPVSNGRAGGRQARVSWPGHNARRRFGG
ncbi:MAG: hypothetical protein R3B90_05380 [Planctomycetaceae bacterium]